MGNQVIRDVIDAADRSFELPMVRTIGPADLKEALAKGLDDFWAMPTHVAFLSLLYPVVCLVLGSMTLGHDLVPDLYPLAAGFAIVGPFAAIGLYELSRRRELGLDTSWKHAFDVVYSKSLGSQAKFSRHRKVTTSSSWALASASCSRPWRSPSAWCRFRYCLTGTSE
jgi:uncharacterized membrane protein